MELIPDPHRPASFTLLIAGVEQSFVDVTAPWFLKFAYARWLGAAITAARPAPPEPLRVLHLGGGAQSLARFIQATRPGSVQDVVELSPELVALVAAALPVTAGVTVHIGDAREFVAQAPPMSFDIVINDVYDGARMPGHVASVEFAALVAALLRPGGRFLANVTDGPTLAFSRVQVATLRAAFAEVALISDRATLRGRRHGNIVLLAVPEAGTLHLDGLARALARDPLGPRVLSGPHLASFTGGAGPMHDPTA